MQGLITHEANGLTLSLVGSGQMPEFVTTLQAEPGGDSFLLGDASGNLGLMSQDGKLKVWQGHQDFVGRVLWETTGSFLSLSDDGKLKRWDSTSLEEVGSLKLSTPGPIALHGESGTIAVACGRKLVVLNSKLEKEYEIQHEGGTIEDLTFFKVGKGIAVASMGGIMIYPANGQGEAVSLSFQAAFLKVVISDDGKMLAGGCLDQAVRFWQLPQARLLHLEGYGGKVQQMAFDPRGGFLVTASMEDIVVWPVKDGSPEGHDALMPPPLNGVVQCLNFHPGGRLFAVGTDEGVLGIYSIEGHSGTVLPLWLGQWEGAISNLCFSEKDRKLMLGFAEGGVKVLATEF